MYDQDHVQSSDQHGFEIDARHLLVRVYRERVYVRMCERIRSKAILHHFQHRSQIFFAPRGAESKDAFEEQTESHNLARWPRFYSFGRADRRASTAGLHTFDNTDR